jgi:hypothetical protein
MRVDRNDLPVSTGSLFAAYLNSTLLGTYDTDQHALDAAVPYVKARSAAQMWPLHLKVCRISEVGQRGGHVVHRLLVHPNGKVEPSGRRRFRRVAP